MPTYRTPDVYVEEISVFPPSVAEVETAIPAFIGYTERATKIVLNDLLTRPTKIYSFAEYEQYFGMPAAPAIAVTLTATDTGFSAVVSPPVTNFLLYYAVKMYFDNGGGKCYIVSVGVYGVPVAPAIEIAPLTAGLEAVALEDEPTLLVCPRRPHPPSRLRRRRKTTPLPRPPSLLKSRLAYRRTRNRANR